MAGNLGGRVLGRVRTLFDVGTTAGLTDGQLLERFATRRDEGAELAFAALVERHGPMVLRVCRGVLRDDHDAMDAFQATFLVLARKGGSLWVRDSIGPWLFRVAGRSARRAARLRFRRKEGERRAAESVNQRDDPARRDELATIVHEEVERLPERYRSVIVLCDLEGRTCEEAARHLGCPVGTVGSRLSRGRNRLRDGLTRRGLAPRDASITAALAALRPGEAVLPSLAASTVEVAVRFISVRAVPSGAVGPLALGVLRTMSLNHWWKVGSVLVAACAATTGFVAFVGAGAAVAQSKPGDPPVFKIVNLRGPEAEGVPVKSGPFRFVVEERGSLEASKSANVFSGVEGQTTIISLLPEGTRVKKGEVVGELDSAALRDQLVNQQLAVEAAQEAFVRAKSDLEVAEIAVIEYEKGIYPQVRSRLEGEIELADVAAKRESDRLNRLRSTLKRLGDIIAARKGTETPSDLVALVEVEARVAEAERSLAVEKNARRNAEAGLQTLMQYSKVKTEGLLRSEIAKAQQVLSRVQAARELEESKKRKLSTQIARCKLIAPSDGSIVYANNPSSGRGLNIEEGATVRERQLIFSVPDLNAPLRVSTKIPEAIVDQLAPGQTARITVDAFPGEVYEGTVEMVAPLPDPASFFNREVKVYTTRVAFSKSAPSLRPGMTAKVEILVAAVDDALTIPVASVIRLDGKDRVAVKKTEGEAEWREVELGKTNGDVVVVEKGLIAGESVLRMPSAWLTDAEKRKLSASPTPPQPKTKSMLRKKK